MKRIFLLLLLPVFAEAQTRGMSDFNLWGAQPGDTFAVYAEKAYIRQEPSLQGAISDSLTTGDLVIMGNPAGNPLTMRGMETRWHEVTLKNGKKGYVWQGLLAIGHYNKGGISFLYGIEKLVKAEFGMDYVVRLKALRNNQLLDMKEWKVRGAEYALSSDGKLFDDMGLENVQTIVRIYFSGDACAIPTDYYYFGWMGDKFVVLPGKTNVSDAGAYNSQEMILFPKEIGGQPGKIIKLSKVDTYGEDMETVEKTTTNRETYIWDGKTVTKQ
jgi:hypothetical protein